MLRLKKKSNYMKLTAKEISEITQGQLKGNPNTTISSFANIKDAKKGDITFLADKRYIQYIQSTKASIIIMPELTVSTTKTTIIVDNPIVKFLMIFDILKPKKVQRNTISKNATIDKNVKIGNNVSISDFCVIKENVIIGDNCEIGPNTIIYNDCEIGNNCIIHGGVSIGGDGFGFLRYNKKILKIPQNGKVIIKNNVEIGSNTTIDRGTFSNTIIEDNVKLDNLIQVGHNVTIGMNTVIAAQCGIAGSSSIGAHCMIGGQVAIADHITIGDNVKIAGKSGVIKNVSNNQIIQGPLAFNIKEFQKSYVYFRNIDKIIKELEQNIEIAKNNKK